MRENAPRPVEERIFFSFNLRTLLRLKMPRWLETWLRRPMGRQSNYLSPPRSITLGLAERLLLGRSRGKAASRVGCGNLPLSTRLAPLAPERRRRGTYAVDSVILRGGET